MKSQPLVGSLGNNGASEWCPEDNKGKYNCTINTVAFTCTLFVRETAVLEHLPGTLIYCRLQPLPGPSCTQWGLGLYSIPFLSIPSPSSLWTTVPQPVWLCVDGCAHGTVSSISNPAFEICLKQHREARGKEICKWPSIPPQNTGGAFHASLCHRRWANQGQMCSQAPVGLTSSLHLHLTSSLYTGSP